MRSWVQIPPARLFFKISPSAIMSKGFFIRGLRVVASRSYSNSEAIGSAIPTELTKLLSHLHVGQFKSRRLFG